MTGSRSAGRQAMLEVRDLGVCFPLATGDLMAVDGVSFEVAPGEVVALVGESGSGKTMVARAVLDLLPPPARIAAGSIALQGRNLTALGAKAMQKVRGARIGMIFQEPMVSLNPAMTVGAQMAEAMRLHTELSKSEIRRKSIEMLERVRIRDAEHCLEAYPHEFSGGMRQRIMLASVLLPRPGLLLADEPTTALDVLIQKEVLDIMMEVTRDLGTSVLLISHDLGLVAKYAARTLVMRNGLVVEQGVTREVLLSPRHDYTRALLEALPGAAGAAASAPARGRAAEARPLLEVEGLRVAFPGRRKWPWSRPSKTVAVDGVDLRIGAGETLALVGESGSGKTTLGRAILQLTERAAGRIVFDGQDYDAISPRARWRLRRQMQVVFQDPFSSLDPRMRLVDIVGEGLRHARDLDRKERRRRALGMLEEVEIPAAFAERFPHELSGGQRQRVSIARAMVMEPRLIVADEPVSALDMTIQAQILELFKRLKRTYGLSYLFITHDLGVVEEVADRVMVMHRGRIVEEGPSADVLTDPRHPYTCQLLRAVPRLVKRPDGSYEVAERQVADKAAPAGFRFSATGRPEEAPGEPEMVAVAARHRVACIAA